jgi:hypothetical protein
VDAVPEIPNPSTSLFIKVPLAKDRFITVLFHSGTLYQRTLKQARL